MVMDSKLIIFGILQLLGIVVAVAILKNDLKWIKRELRRGSKKFSGHDDDIADHSDRITALETTCNLRHGSGD